MPWKWCLSSSSHNVKAPSHLRFHWQVTSPIARPTQSMSSYTWSSSRPPLRIASLSLSGHYFIDLLMNFQGLPDPYKTKSTLLIWKDQVLHKVISVYFYFLCPADKQHRVLSVGQLPWTRLWSLYSTLPLTICNLLGKNIAHAQLHITSHHFSLLTFGSPLS